MFHGEYDELTSEVDYYLVSIFPCQSVKVKAIQNIAKTDFDSIVNGPFLVTEFYI